MNKATHIKRSSHRIVMLVNIQTLLHVCEIHSFIMTHACNIRDHLILYYTILKSDVFYVWKHNYVFSHESVRFHLLLHGQGCQLQHMRWTLSANVFIELLSIDWWNKLLTSQHMFLICWIYLILNHMFSVLNDYEGLQESFLCGSQTIWFLALRAVAILSWGDERHFNPFFFF